MPAVTYCIVFDTVILMQSIDALLSAAREQAGITRSELSRRTGTTRAALLEYEKGTRLPRVDTFLRVLDATGATIAIELPTVTRDAGQQRPASGTLAEAASQLGADDALNWRRLVSDFVANDFVPANSQERAAMLQPEAVTTAGSLWQSFVHALAEHLAFHAEVPLPLWVDADPAETSAFWWPAHGELASQRAAAMAWSPASFQRRRILIDGRELPTVTR